MPAPLQCFQPRLYGQLFLQCPDPFERVIGLLSRALGSISVRFRADRYKNYMAVFYEVEVPFLGVALGEPNYLGSIWGFQTLGAAFESHDSWEHRTFGFIVGTLLCGNPFVKARDFWKHKNAEEAGCTKAVSRGRRTAAVILEVLARRSVRG